MNQALYNKEVSCPICKNIFHTKKVRSSAIRIKKRDTDFCVYYNGENPIFYAVFVCPNCGYAALESVFERISPTGKKIITSRVSNQWVQRDFGGERTNQEAIEVYKLALLCGQLSNEKKGILGTICLRLAWFYRFIGEDKELHFLKHAKNCFEEAFLYEQLPIGNLDEVSMLYLLGELNRRLGKYEDAINWFNKAVSNPAIKRKKKLEMQAREQWILAKEEYKKIKSEA
ncbi:DUF2225 domain-containing protein [Crassaminicella thermophila]|uniref:DUF2225 domain-containing protein n=1 Tax=Crassaminicella thermophila TaxID=2599308 RepID=A0A5C0SB39_CRATE|nr:DUF2225 domain-containing protein [Crassaminicella thermophila]QEK11803.1 DUF2225 domain-containing protein [Crassaminicella thermophila]